MQDMWEKGGIMGAYLGEMYERKKMGGGEVAGGGEKNIERGGRGGGLDERDTGTGGGGMRGRKWRRMNERENKEERKRKL